MNRQGIPQQSKKGIEPQGDSKPAWQTVAELATALGHDIGIGKFADVRKKLAPVTPPTPGSGRSA